MRSIFSNAIIILLFRIFLAGLFIVSGLDKISDLPAFASSILNYKIVGPDLAMLTATILPFLELLCGFSLVLGLYHRAGALLITSMLVCFTLLVSSALLRGLDISCGCFTQSPEAGKIGYNKILENCGMIIMGLWLLFAPEIDFKIGRLLHRQSH
jgi:putative oxidoreductase